eukprot:1162098-Pelagomonas_calceolata.AAC.8
MAPLVEKTCVTLRGTGKVCHDYQPPLTPDTLFSYRGHLVAGRGWACGFEEWKKKESLGA